MALTNVAIKALKPKDKPFKKADEKGLFLLINPNGNKFWRFKYRFAGKEKLLAFGPLDDVTLAMAREKRDDARKLLADGIDPSEHRKVMKQVQVERAANSFEVIAREWFVKFKINWVENHSDKIIRRLERDIFPWIGGKPIAEITPRELLETLQRIEKRGAIETAHRAMSSCSQIFRYAIVTARAERDPTLDLKGAIPPVKANHFAAQIAPKEFGQLLKTIDTYHGSLVTCCALKLAPLVFVRPGELRQAKWTDIDLERGVWSYTVTKTNTPHIVPLSTQAITILQEVHPFTCSSEYVFPSPRSFQRPISDNALLGALRRMDIRKDETSIHGFRATARTLLDEVLGFRPEIIEQQLAHAVRDPNGRAYNRTKHLDERKKMMQDWADYLDELKE